MEKLQWVCPYCNHAATIQEDDVNIFDSILSINNKDGYRCLTSRFIVCPNPRCKKFSLTATLKKVDSICLGDGSPRQNFDNCPVIKYWRLVPETKSKHFPDYVPEQILSDYREACSIKELSPKASATLSRRCIQGIIRDFFGARGHDLKAEIESIKDKVDTLTWQAIDAVRSVGNIGAHMEKDVDLIIDIEPNEAELLISLIESLLQDWYVARHEKEEQLKSIVKLAEEKKAAKKAP